MKQSLCLFAFLLLIAASPAHAKKSKKHPAHKQATTATVKTGKVIIKKKTVYRSHTQVDFLGDTIQGKNRAPEVFYIFQRKRAEAHHVVKTPANFDTHRKFAADRVLSSLGMADAEEKGP